MPKDDLIYLRHILDAIARIEEYTNGITLEAFKDERMVQDAVIRQFQVIGEAAKKISTTQRDSSDSIP